MDKGWGVVIVAAGRGTRMGTTESKQFLLLQDKPVFIHTLEVFAVLDEIREMVLVTGTADVERRQDWVKEYQLDSRVRVIPGGKERQHSVHKGLEALGTDWVLVHDGVRPFVNHEQIKGCMAAAIAGGGATCTGGSREGYDQTSECGRSRYGDARPRQSVEHSNPAGFSSFFPALRLRIS